MMILPIELNRKLHNRIYRFPLYSHICILLGIRLTASVNSETSAAHCVIHSDIKLMHSQAYVFTPHEHFIIKTLTLAVYCGYIIF